MTAAKTHILRVKTLGEHARNGQGGRGLCPGEQQDDLGAGIAALGL